MPAVYDDEKTKEDELRSITGIDKAEEKAIEARAHDGIASAEADGGTPENDRAARNEQGKLDDQVGEGYTESGNNGNSSNNARISGRRKQGIIAGSLVTLAVGAGGMGFMAAPNFIVNHLRELMLGKVSQLQNFHTRRYRRSKMHKIRDMFTADGRRSSKVITDMEARGYKFDWGKPRGKTIQGIKPPGADDFIRGDDMSTHIEEYMEVRHPLRTSRWKTKRTESLYRTSKLPRKSPVVDGQDYDDPEKQMNKTLAKEALDEADIKLSADVSDPPEDTPEDVVAKTDEEIKDMIQSDGSLDPIKQKLRAGTSLDELTSTERRVARIGVDFDDELAEIIANIASSGSVASKVSKGIKSATMSTEILDRICTVKKRLQAVTLAARLFRARSLLRLAASFVKASDDTRRGKVDPKLMNALFKRVTTTDSNGYPIGASEGFAYIMKNKFSKSKNDEFKGSFGVDGKPTGVVKRIQDTTNIPGCSVFQNVGFQVGVAVVEVAVAFFSGGSSEAAAEPVKQGLKVTIKEAIERGITKAMIRKGLMEVGKTIAIEVTFDMAMTYVQLLAEKSMSLNFTGQEKGGELGNILAAGSGVLNKQRSLRAGQVPSTVGQYVQAQTEYIAWKKEETKKQSLYTRIFDYNNYDSVAFNLASTVAFMPMTPAAIGASVGNSFSSIVSMVLTNPARIVAKVGAVYGGSTFAQDSDEISFETLKIGDKSLATDPAGNLLPIMPSGIENIDPEKNIEELIEAGEIESESLEPVKGSNFEQHIANCVDALDTISVIEHEDQSKPEFDCLATQSMTKKFKAHLAYLDMVDGVDAEFFPDEIGGKSGASANPTSGNLTEPSYAKNPSVKVDGAPPGAHKTSNCTGTFTTGAASLRTVILEKWQPPVSSIGGYSCRKNTASPGTSIHGLGRALDVMIDSTTPEGLEKGNEIRNWVINNATQLGVQRVIWNKYTWAANKDGWRPYGGPNPHTDHLHIEINLDASTKGNLGR
ncbi:hypothetical protein KC968_02490 [Candidatus Saccharibacteria bacterium]|nr:hypothetical protein [Candidatus Saccharibacteria bacterium]